MEHGHYITWLELLQLLGLFAAPFLLGAAFVQFRLMRRSTPVALATSVCVAIGVASLALTAGLHFLTMRSGLANVLGFPGWVVGPPAAAGAFATAIVWWRTSPKLPNEEL